MTITNKQALSAAADSLIATKAAIEAMPMTGAVLYWEGGLAVNFTDEGQPVVGGLARARIFSDADRGLGEGRTQHPLLAKIYVNGKNERAFLRTIGWAKRDALHHLEQALATLQTAVPLFARLVGPLARYG